VIEGLRLLPFYEEAREARTAPECSDCKKTTTVMMRQAMGCGYEVPNPAVPVRPFTPAFWTKRGRKTTACAGFTANLPLVREVLDLYDAYEAGYLAEAIGEPPTNVLIAGLSHLRAGINEHTRSKLKKEES
jgi:hypothetical protein